MLVEKEGSQSPRYQIGETVKIVHLSTTGQVVSYDPSSSKYSVKLIEGNTIECTDSVLEKRKILFG